MFYFKHFTSSFVSFLLNFSHFFFFTFITLANTINVQGENKH